MSSSSLRVAIDIGGTFTDGVILNETTGSVWVAKSLTTPDDPGEAVSTVLGQLLDQVAEASPNETNPGQTVREVVHGTTLVTNALIERKGARTALLVTKGTADTLDIRRELRYDLYDLHFQLPDPLVPRSDRHEIDERMAADGSVVRPLDLEKRDELLAWLDRTGAKAVGVCLLHAYANGEHESRLREMLAAERPDINVSLSNEVAGELGEFERMSTVVANAYVKPLVSDYLRQLESRMKKADVKAPLRIMLSSGGFTSSSAAAEFPITLLESGPAGGVLSGVNAGLANGLDNVLAFDMGGTTAKVCVVRNGEPSTTRLFEVARVHRFKRGSGLPLRLTSIDLIEIGAGGGSIAQSSELGLLTVGPESSGAVPGPVCYARGGTEATVTDADLWLGYLNKDSFLGGTMRLDLDATGSALEKLGRQFGMTADEVAYGIHNIVNENMAAAARVHIAEKGHDPRDFTLVATGGAGPVHAVAIARKLGLRRVLCPPAAGAGSCVGFLSAPARVDRSWARPSLVSAIDWSEVQSALDDLKQDAIAELDTTGTDATAVSFEVEVEMRYKGQGHTVGVVVDFADIGPGFSPVLIDGFAKQYEKLFGRTVPHGHPEVVAWRLIAREPLRQLRFSRMASGADATGSAKGAVATRPIYQPVREAFGDAPVYKREHLEKGTVLDAPLVIEERESTFVVPVPATVRITDDFSILVEMEEQ